jgi:hypothetical protein
MSKERKKKERPTEMEWAMKNLTEVCMAVSKIFMMMDKKLMRILMKMITMMRKKKRKKNKMKMELTVALKRRKRLKGLIIRNSWICLKI